MLISHVPCLTGPALHASVEKEVGMTPSEYQISNFITKDSFVSHRYGGNFLSSHRNIAIILKNKLKQYAYEKTIDHNMCRFYAAWQRNGSE